MPFHTNLKPNETLIVNGTRIRATNRSSLVVLDQVPISKLDRDGNKIKVFQKEEAEADAPRP